MIKKIFIVIFLLAGSFLSADPLRDAVENSDRTAKNVSRDVYRNPYETISFFKIEPDMKVIELSPGGGWYTEILANYLNDSGLLIAAHFNPKIENNYLKRSRANYEQMLINNEAFKKVKLVSFKALKPGGFFGVVEHRAKPETSFKKMKKTGYVTEAYAIQAAEKIGFVLIDKSEINSNVKDTTDHPKGVWTLPPTLRLKDVDKSKYLEIGESDRMTLLFMKPENS